MNTTPKIIDNWLEQDYYDHLKNSVFSTSFPWVFCQEVANLGEMNDEHFFFTHRVFDRFEPQSSFVKELDHLLVNYLQVKSIIRIRFNLYPNIGKLVEHDLHEDYQYNHNTAVLYLNTCNGYTGFEDGTKVESVDNRVVLFDGSTPHRSTTCTDQKARIVLSVSYF
tara:strand:+ start:857 stop:1354 length:498 start_codon:yes stop_codon:yes gene_type:complete